MDWQRTAPDRIECEGYRIDKGAFSSVFNPAAPVYYANAGRVFLGACPDADAAKDLCKAHRDARQ